MAFHRAGALASGPSEKAGAVIMSDPFDVLCVGHASYDLVFAVPHHPGPDEKMVADALMGCGGGPAANGAVMAARLGCRTAFAGYLDTGGQGDRHLAELQAEGVDTRLIIRGMDEAPLSVVLVKPGGERALVNYPGTMEKLPEGAVDFSVIQPKAILLDGHQTALSLPLTAIGVPTVLDAGSFHAQTEALMYRVDYLACSEKFARQWLGADDPGRALDALAERSPAVIITLGERGLIWRRGSETGHMDAFPVQTVDTTGAGDAFHGAFAAGLAQGLGWEETLRQASAAGALCCEVMGARPGLPSRQKLTEFLTAY